MTEYSAFDRHKDEGKIYLEHRVEMMYAGDDFETHLLKWIHQGYGADVIQDLDEKVPGFAASRGGEYTSYDWEVRFLERYGSELPESISVNYCINQIEHIGDSIEDNFVGGSPVDIYSKVWCSQPEFIPREFFDVVVDDDDELIFQELEE